MQGVPGGDAREEHGVGAQGAGASASPTPVSEVAEITRLRLELNERNLKLMEERAKKHNTGRTRKVRLAGKFANRDTARARDGRLRPSPRADTATNTAQIIGSRTKGKPSSQIQRRHQTGAAHRTSLPPLPPRPALFHRPAINCTLYSHAHRAPPSSNGAFIDARTEWPHEAELRQVQKRLREILVENDELNSAQKRLRKKLLEKEKLNRSLEETSRQTEEACARLRRRVRTLQHQNESLASELASRIAEVEEESAACRQRLDQAAQLETKYENEIANQQREMHLQAARTEIMQRRLDDALAAASAGRDAISAIDSERRRSAELSATLARKEGLMAKQARRAAAAVEIQNALIACKRRLTQRESQIKECRDALAQERASSREMMDRCVEAAEESAAAECAREEAEESFQSCARTKRAPDKD